VRVLGQAADSLGLRLDGTTLRDVASRIEWRKVAMRTIDQDAAAHPEGLGNRWMRRRWRTCSGATRR
jgi:DNA helicase-2/ATP-dependent DNA helicase PcrA